MKGQSRKHSVIEAIINVMVGYCIALLTQLFVFPLFGIYISLSSNMSIGIVFTIVSLVRSYILRRAFNAWHVYPGDAIISRTKR